MAPASFWLSLQLLHCARHGLLITLSSGKLAGSLLARPPTPPPACLQGRPVYIQHIGAIKIKQLAEITTEDRMIRFHVQVGQGWALGWVGKGCGGESSPPAPVMQRAS